MTSFKLIFRNVHKNIRDYLIYFLTLTLSVSLFYAFNSISDQPAFSDMGITGSLLYDQLGILLSALSVIIAVVLAFLIIYANQFLLKRRKQFVKGVTQIAQEGAIQIFQEYKGGMEEIIVGVVGVLQFDVLRFRLENEYNVEIRLENLPYEHIRWIENKEEVDVDALTGTSDMKKVIDMKGNPLLLFVNAWSVGMTLDRNEGLVLSEFSKN